MNNKHIIIRENENYVIHEYTYLDHFTDQYVSQIGIMLQGELEKLIGKKHVLTNQHCKSMFEALNYLEANQPLVYDILMNDMKVVTNV